MAEPAPAPAGVRVVRVTEETLPTWRDVRLAALIDTPRAFGGTYAQSRAHTDEQWRARALGTPTWLALEGEHPVGTVGLWWVPGAADGDVHLIGMWVPTGARGRGIGDLLVRHALGAAREAGARRVLLDVAHENGPARALYARHGFVPTGTTGALPWAPEVTELEMACEVST